ncbi:MAG TPA: hypothetical protein P5307_25460, partial [Pirellulaceae bacterium]|nr:hypothetical protein [Pirellulaceae bacterium]
MMTRLILAFAVFSLTAATCRAELQIPGATAYLQPDAGGARVLPDQGIASWKDPATTVKWFGELK